MTDAVKPGLQEAPKHAQTPAQEELKDSPLTDKTHVPGQIKKGGDNTVGEVQKSWKTAGHFLQEHMLQLRRQEQSDLKLPANAKEQYALKIEIGNVARAMIAYGVEELPVEL